MKRKIIKLFGFALGVLVACGIGLSSNIVNTKAEANFSINDEFDVNPVAACGAKTVVGISGDGNATHGAIPAESWGDPAKIADESYLIYEIGNGVSNIDGLYVNIVGKVWGQNDDVAYSENKINFYVGETVETCTNLIWSKSASDNNKFEEAVNCSSAVAEYSKAYLKVELVQSKSSCGHSECVNGRHSCGGVTVPTEDGYCNLHYFGVRLFKLSISSSAPIKDELQPIPNDFKSKLPEEIFAMQEYAFPEIVFTDDFDGVTDYILSVIDPYNNAFTLPVNAKSFTPEYEGIYTFEISSADKAGNKYTDKFSISTVVAPNMPQIYWQNFPEKNGRVGVEYQIEPIAYASGEKYTTSITVKDPKGKDVAVKNNKFTPDMVGEYSIYYSATNEVGTTKLFSRVYVKYNTNGEDPYKISLDTSHWVGNVAKDDDDNFLIKGTDYCKLPFSLKDGIQMNINLSEQNNSWLGIYFTRTSHYGSYYFERADYAKHSAGPGLYMLVYKDNDGLYYCNIDYVGLTGDAMVVANHSGCGGANSNVTIALKKNGLSDNIGLYVNGVKNENYELNASVLASVISDNEGFTYLGFGNVTNGNAMLNKIDICDSTPPEIVIDGELPKAVNLGAVITLPTIKAVDAHDGEMNCIAHLYSPEGKEIDLTESTLKMESEGIYYYIVQAKDLSNNENYVIYEIAVGNTNKETYFSEKKNSGCKSSMINGGIAVLGTMVTIVVIVGRKKYE